MSDRFYRGMKATDAIGQLNGLNHDVQAAKEATAAGVASVAQSAAQAVAARDAALQAWGASTAPAEQLAAVARTIHAGAVVDVFLYDTSKDSDGGAWRQRCRHTSWESEPLVPGKWLGQHADTVAAVAAGGMNGDFFQFTVNGTFWKIVDAPNGAAVEVFRGSRREFPAIAAIVAEDRRVVIYDATTTDLPMWMVFTLGFEGVNESSRMLGYTAVSCVRARNGVLLAGHATIGGHVDALSTINFPADDGFMYTLPGHYHAYPNTNGAWRAGIASREGYEGYLGRNPSGLPGIPGVDVADVAVTVLPDAPVDPRTGLPKLTVAVATAQGVCALRDDGTVVSAGPGIPFKSIRFTERDCLEYTYYGHVGRTLHVRELLDGFGSHVLIGNSTGFNSSNKYIPNPIHYADKVVKDAAAGEFGALTRFKLGDSADGSMVAVISNTYSSGWQVGDTRGAWLADTAAGSTIASPEVVLNGKARVDASHWEVVNGAGLSVIGGELVVACNDASNPIQQAQQELIARMIPGRVYSLTYSARLGTAPRATVLVETATVSLVARIVSTTEQQKETVLFTLPGGSDSCMVRLRTEQGVGTAFFGEVSIKLADEDRGSTSTATTALAVIGDVVKAPVAPGAQLAAFTGFSEFSYLEQPHNPRLDFGTGDFCFMWWAEVDSVPFSRALPGGASGGVVGFETLSDGTINPYIGADGYNGYILGEKQPLRGFSFFVYTRRAGMLEVWLNKKLIDSRPNSINISQVGALLRVGRHLTGSVHPNGVALLRASATAPTSDQIAKIYYDELVLFQPGAQCTINGNVEQRVDSLAHDEVTDLLHVGTNWGFRSAFHGLQRVESQWVGDPLGGINKLAASGGTVLIGGSAKTGLYQPALRVRDELRRRLEVRRAMAREDIPFDFDGLVAQTRFPLPIGFAVKGVFIAGSKKRRGNTKDYTVTFDGYRETVVFGVSPGATWVQITANRSI